MTTAVTKRKVARVISDIAASFQIKIAIQRNKTSPEKSGALMSRPRSLCHPARSQGSQKPGPGMAQWSATRDHAIRLINETKHKYM